jgi:hypothetical protein
VTYPHHSHHGGDSGERIPQWAVELYNRVSTVEAHADRLERELFETNKRMELLMAVTQADLDALAASLGDLQTKLTSADAGLQAEIDSLQSANPALDLSGVQAKLNELSSQVDATAAMVPAAPAPADVPAPAEGPAPADVPAPVTPDVPADPNAPTV